MSKTKSTNSVIFSKLCQREEYKVRMIWFWNECYDYVLIECNVKMIVILLWNSNIMSLNALINLVENSFRYNWHANRE